MNIKHDPVDSPVSFIQFLQGKITDETSAQEKESVDTGKSIGDGLKQVGLREL